MINSAVHEHLAKLSIELGRRLTVTIELDYNPGNPEYYWSTPSIAHNIRISGDCEKNKYYN